MSKLVVICGPMYAGKTSELIRRMRNAHVALDNPVILRPETDTRSVADSVTTHDGLTLPARTVDASLSLGWATDVHERLTRAIGFDEAQFFEPAGLLRVVNQLLDWDVDVTVAGLSLDYLGVPFESMAQLLPYADEIDLRHAVCTCPLSRTSNIVCARPAARTQKLDWDKKPVLSADTRVDVGGEDKYAARCTICFKQP